MKTLIEERMDYVCVDQRNPREDSRVDWEESLILIGSVISKKKRI